MTSGRKLAEPSMEYDLDPCEPVFTSGVVSRLLGIPVWVLKQLDREELVSPPRKRGCSRLYSKEQMGRLCYIWHYMKTRHVNVQGVRIILQMQEVKKRK